AGMPPRLGFGERQHVVLERHRVAVRGPVDEQLVDLIDANRVEALLHARHELLSVEPAVGDLGGDEKIRARQAGAANGVTDLALGIVVLSRVEMAIADLDRLQHRLGTVVAAPPRRAEAELRNWTDV